MDNLIASNIGIKNGMEHRDGAGNLIYAQWDRLNTMAQRYDEWRSKWCNKHRLDKAPDGFREGKINEETLVFALRKGYKPAFTFGELIAILNSSVTEVK